MPAQTKRSNCFRSTRDEDNTPIYHCRLHASCFFQMSPSTLVEQTSRQCLGESFVQRLSLEDFFHTATNIIVGFYRNGILQCVQQTIRPILFWAFRQRIDRHVSVANHRALQASFDKREAITGESLKFL